MAKTPVGGFRAPPSTSPAELDGRGLPLAADPDSTPTKKLPSSKPSRPSGRYAFISSPPAAPPEGASFVTLPSTVPPPPVPRHVVNIVFRGRTLEVKQMNATAFSVWAGGLWVGEYRLSSDGRPALGPQSDVGTWLSRSDLEPLHAIVASALVVQELHGR